MKIGLVAAAVSQNTRALAEAWVASGHDVCVVSVHGEAWRDDIRVDRIGGAGSRLRLTFLDGQPARTVLAGFGADVVVGYHITSYGLLAARTGLKPLALIAAGGDILPEQYGALPRRVLMPLAARWAIGRADRVFSWAPHMTERLVRLGATRERIFEMPRGIDLALFRTDRRDVAFAGRPLRVVSTRGLKALYRIDVLVRALGAVPEARLDIYGEGPHRKALETLADELGLRPRVTFHGARPYDEIAAALRSADAYASLTASDGVSASLLEAMAAGCLPIVSDIPAARTWITPGENGLLVDGSDAGSVAAALRRALQDEALRRLAAERNRAIVERRADLYGNVAAIGRELETLAASHASVVASANAVRRETSASSEKSRPGSDPGRT